MKSHPVLPVNVAAFEDSCGIGVNITPDQIEDCVSTCTHNLQHTEVLPEPTYRNGTLQP